MKKIVFIHQNFPGQFIHIARHLLGRPDVQIFGIGMADNVKTNSHQNLQVLTYPKPTKPIDGVHHYAYFFEESVRYGQSVARILLALRAQIGAPDLIVAHPSWGEALFIRDVFPAVPLLLYNEYFDADPDPIARFDSEFELTFDECLKGRARSAIQLISQVQATAGISPTHWQVRLFPSFARAKTQVIHDGIDSEKITPLESSPSGIPDLTIAGATFRASDQIITYLSRNLEPHRGFHRFMRALPRIQKNCPNAIAVIVGDDEVSYSKLPKNFPHWRAAMLAEVEADLDMQRVYFFPKLNYLDYLQILRRSKAHVYLTYPSVLSWSFMEALASGAAVIGSRTAPVQEMIRDGENGILVDFFNQDELVEAVTRVLNNPEQMRGLRENARQTIVTQYDLKSICLPRQMNLFQELGILVNESFN